MTDKEFLSWIYDRMIYKYGENENVDYLHRFKRIIDSLQEEPRPQFKVGDIIRSKVWELVVHEIVSMDDGAYYFENGGMVRLDDQEQWELVEEPVNEELEDFALQYAGHHAPYDDCMQEVIDAVKAGAEWQSSNFWKDAQGDDLPEIDREVIVLTQNYPLKGSEYAVSFAHRPYKGKYIGKSLTTGNIETFENKTYGKGGWNIPDVKWWLDCNMDSIFKK